MKIENILDTDVLDKHVRDGYVKKTARPDGEYVIYNYSPAAQYEELWDDTVRQCRGLIVDRQGNVVARPLPKFFNYSEHDKYDEDVTPDTEVVAYDKLDGSLGIVYWDKSGTPKVATRGSFTSPMALHASEKIKDLLIPHMPNTTILVEIIYPDNQIVLDYHGIDDLFLIGGVDINTGDFIDPVDVLAEIRGVYPDGGFNYIVQEYREIRTVQDALNNLNRDNREGFVLHTYSGTMVKVKQDDYIRLHKAVFAANKRTIWNAFVHQLAHEDDSGELLNTRRLRNIVEGVKNTPRIPDLMVEYKRILPRNMYNAAMDYYLYLSDAVTSDVTYISSVVTSAEFDNSVERKDVYKYLTENLHNNSVVGFATDAMLSTGADRDLAITRIIAQVVYNYMPKKGDRLTEALNEEDE